MIWGIEGRHAWFPALGSGLTRTNIVRTPNPDTVLGQWSGAAAFWNNAATVTRDTAVTAPLNLPACVKIVTTGAAVAEGGRVAMNVVAGKTYRVSAYVRGAAGGEQVKMAIGSGAVGSAQTAVEARSASFTRLFLTFTATGTGETTLAFVGPTGSKVAQTFYVAAALVEEASLYQPYFPTPMQLLTKRAAWTGTAYESPSTAEAPALTLGLLSDDNAVKVWPRIKLSRVSGLMSLGDAEDKSDQPVRRIGELARLSFRRGKTVTYEGRIEARSLRSLREVEATLRSAFADESGDGRMEVTPHPLNPDFTGVVPKFYVARPLGLEVIDQQDSNDYRRRLVLALRLHDPRYFDNETEVHKVSTVETLTSYSFT